MSAKLLIIVPKSSESVTLITLYNLHPSEFRQGDKDELAALLVDTEITTKCLRSFILGEYSDAILIELANRLPRGIVMISENASPYVSYSADTVLFCLP